MANKNYEIKHEYKPKTNYRKKDKKDKKEKEIPRKKEEFTNEVDSDGFEIVGTKDVKAQKQRDEMKQEYIRKR